MSASDMSAREHVEAAEQCLRHVEIAADAERRDEDFAEAQVHATLALAIATIDIANPPMEVSL